MTIPNYQSALLHAKAYRVLRGDVARMLEPFELSMPQWALLSMLAKKPAIRPTEIAKELSVEIPMVTSLLNSLVERKLITRTKGTKDKRERTLSLTAKGKKTVAESESNLKKELAVYFKGLTKDDIEGYLRVLQHIADKDN